MNLKEQVTSLELSKKLKELGVEQNSIFWWVNYTSGKEDWDLKFSKQRLASEFISAFSVAELGEMLQEWKNLRLDSTKDSNGWSIAKNETDRIYADTEADARGKMLIYLLENNLIKND